MNYREIDGTTYYKLRSEKRRSPVIGLIALVIAYGVIATVVGSTFGYAAIG